MTAFGGVLGVLEESISQVGDGRVNLPTHTSGDFEEVSPKIEDRRALLGRIVVVHTFSDYRNVGEAMLLKGRRSSSLWQRLTRLKLVFWTEDC